MLSEVLPEQSEWRIIVDDTGPGVNEKERLFDPFHQEGAKPAGAGLGLAISRHLARGLGGDLWCEPSRHGGARFVASFGTHFETGTTLPLVDAGQEAAQFSLGLEALTVLVVDDVLPAREFLQEALNGLGCTCLAVPSAKEGYTLSKRQTFDLILIDLQMPEVDGWQAGAQFRGLLGDRPLLIAMSASGAAHDAGQLRASGFNGFCLKPLYLSHLRQLIRRARVHGQSTSRAQPVFDPERWQELRGVQTSAGGTLLELMLLRVGESLPQVVEEIERNHQAKQGVGLAHSLHHAAGLLALIGAREAHSAVCQAEDLAEAGTLVRDDAALSQALAKIETVLAELRQHGASASLAPMSLAPMASDSSKASVGGSKTESE